MKSLTILFLSLALFLRANEKWDVSEVAEHSFVFESKGLSKSYSCYYNGTAFAGIRQSLGNENDGTIYPSYTWRITDAGLLVFLEGSKTVTSLRKIRVMGDRYQVEENGYSVEYVRYPFNSTKSKKELAWTPDPKDVEELRQALLQVIPPEYKVSPYAAFGDFKGIAIYHDDSSASPKFPTGPQIPIEFCPKVEVSEWQHLLANWKATVREYKSLSNEERKKKWGDSRPKFPQLPAAYFRSLGITEIPRTPQNLEENFELKPEERKSLQLVDAVISKVITIYEEEPNQTPKPAESK